MAKLTTKHWAKSHGISIAATPPTVRNYHKKFPISAVEIATRAIILQGIVAVASGVNAKPVANWFRDQGVWKAVTPKERRLLKNPEAIKEAILNQFQWQMETEWTLLWMIGKVKALGLPTRQCDTRLMIDKIIPALGSDITSFMQSAKMRAPGVILAEDDRHYDLWCRYCLARSNKKAIPDDLLIPVLYQRRYAFEWLNGNQAWDDVTCDS